MPSEDTATAAPGVWRWSASEPTRAALHPIRYQDILDFYKQILKTHWTIEDVDLAKDPASWAELSADEQRFIAGQLVFFLRADNIVIANIEDNLIRHVDCEEARAAYAAQALQEVIHAEAYSRQVELLLGDAAAGLAAELLARPSVRHMHDWAQRWCSADIPIGLRLVAFVAVEGIMFSASFCSVQWLRERDNLPGVTKFNEFIARDENVHTQLGCLLVSRYLLEHPPAADVLRIVTEAVDVVSDFVDEVTPAGLAGITAAGLREYVRHCADGVLVDMGYAPHYRASCPYSFMEKLYLSGGMKTNFFEKRSSAYQATTSSRLAIDDTPVESDDDA